MAEELSPIEQDRWQALADSIGDFVAGAQAGDDAGSGAAFAQLTQVSGQLDVEAFLNALHVPADAGEYEPGLRRILGRIPDGCGRWVECKRGWYPLLVELDEALARLIPGYMVLGVKQKYGSLRFDWSASNDLQLPPGDPAPKPAEGESRSAEAFKQRWDAWWERRRVWMKSAEGKAVEAELDRRSELAGQLVEAAEQRAAHTCEECGSPGEMTCTYSAVPWQEVQCPRCQAEHQTMPASEWDAWWEVEKPRHEAHMRWFTVNQLKDDRCCVVSADEELRVAPPAVYAHTSEQARKLGLDPAYTVAFIANDAVGQAYLDAVRERYAEHERAHAGERAAAEAEQRYYSVRRPEGAPTLYHLDHAKRDDDLLYEGRVALGLSARTPQPEHLAGPLLEDW